MAIINIKEIDSTVAGLSTSENHVVFIPGNASIEVDNAHLDTPLLFSSLSDFKEVAGEDIPTYTRTSDEGKPFINEDNEIMDAGYLQAKLLLSKGLQVLYKIPAKLTPVGEAEPLDQEEETIQIKSKNAFIYELAFSRANPTKDEFEADKANYFYFKSVGNMTQCQEGDTFVEGRQYFTKKSTIGYAEVEGKTKDVEDDKIYLTFNDITYDNATFKDATESQTLAFDGNITVAQINTFYKTGKFVASSVTYTKLFVDKTTIEKRQEQTKEKATTYAQVIDAIEDESFYEELRDKSLYDVRFLTNGGYKVVDRISSVPSSISALISLANDRGDCEVLIDHNYDCFKADILACAEKVATKYGAMFSPWCRYTISGKEVILPASVAYLDAFASAVVNNPTWYATAGALRGTITGEPIKAYGESFANTLTKDTGVSVNPITKINPYGVLIWGNRTLNNNSQGLFASSFLNIRQLCCDLKKQLYISAKGWMFEQNSDRLWFNFKSQIASLLDRMQTGQGIRGYRIIKQTPDSKAQIKCLVRIIPIEAVEKFEITVELADTLDVNVVAE